MPSSITARSFVQFFLFGLVLLTTLPPLIFQEWYFSATDISSWIDDWSRLTECIPRHEVPCGKISFFPLAYLLNSWLIGLLGSIQVETPHAITIINSIFLSLPLLFFFAILPKKNAQEIIPVYLAAILCTSLPVFYIHSGALEVQSGITIGIFISSWILLNDKFFKEKHGSILLFLIPSGVLIASYKDTNLLIVAGAISLCHAHKIVAPRAYQRNNFFGKPRSLHLFIALSALSLGAISAIGYNHLRYGTPIPAAYLSIAKQTSPTIEKSLEFILATFLSPNGGIFVFWSAGIGCCLFLLRNSFYRIRPAATISFLALISASALGFSFWWAPFGWDAWGNRLIIPSALAGLIVIISTAVKTTPPLQSGIEPPIQRYRARLFPIIALTALVIPSIHYTLSAYYSDRTKLIRTSLFGGKHCNLMMSEVRNDSQKLGLGLWRTDYYYNCARERFFHIPTIIRSHG